MENIFLEVRNINKSFGKFQALKDVNMTIEKGSIYGLVGPNGAGKSTIIRHITGVYKPDSGEILMEKSLVFENPDSKRRIGYIPDDVFYFTQSNILDMKKFYKDMYPGFDEGLFEKLKECFPAVSTKKNIRSMSKGMQKQALFWLALCIRADFLVLDEPVDGLDPVMRRQVWSLIMSDVAEHGTTVLVSSHNLRELEDVCDHVGIMDKGNLVLERSLSDLQGSIVKLQVAFEQDIQVMPEGLDILHSQEIGKVKTLIIKGDKDEIEKLMAPLNPVLMDLLPLTLEEIFIYEMGGEDYAVKEILF
ncbi:MAG: ABC transporter ATP-binding protein [Lachnospiraceae bacterium]|nr:ABC transporter ATP-binding protein [Lachnospiraceae bacterium]